MSFSSAKISGSGLKVIRVPRVFVMPRRSTPVTGTPRAYSWK